MKLELACRSLEARGCTEYVGTLTYTDSNQVFLIQALPVVGVFLAFAIGIYMGRMVWS